MDLVKAFTDLLPIVSPSHIECLEKQESIWEAQIYLSVDEDINAFYQQRSYK